MFIIENAYLIDGLNNPPCITQVKVEDSRIVEIGENLERDSHGIIDAEGKTLMPGLIDAHCHITFDEPNSNDELFFHRREGLSAIIAAHNVQKLVRAGVTGFLDADSVFDVGVDLRDAIEAGLISGPRMSTGGNALLTAVGGTAGRLLPDEGRRGYGKIVRNRDEIINETRRQIKNGVDWIKVHVTGLTPRQKSSGEVQVWSLDELKTVVDTAHELETPVVGHCRNASSTRDAAKAGFDLILHATHMDDEAVDAVIEYKTPIVPTFTFQANLADYGEVVGASQEIRNIFKREIVDSSETLRRAYDNGVPLLCGTESGFSITPYGEWHYRELEVFIKYLGMSNLEAIQCGTSSCARAIGLDGETGAIEVGRLADMIIVNGDPSKDICVLGNKKNITKVFIGGEEINLSDLPQITDPPEWRAGTYGSQKLNWDLVNQEQ